MTEKQAKAIERCNELIKESHSCWIGLSNQDAIKTVLDLLETKENEKQVHIKLKQQYKKEYIDTKEEISRKEKRILDLEFALIDMVLQFANESKNSINTMGLSALEIAFTELNFNDPMPIKKVHDIYKKLAQEYYK